MKWIIKHKNEGLFWSNEIGWVDRASADIFTDTDGNLPIAGEWMELDSIQGILHKMSDDQGWNAESEIIHLCGFIESLFVNPAMLNDFHPAIQFDMYLTKIAEEENVGCDSVCEQCGQPAEYDPTYIACKKCRNAVGLS